MGPRAGLDGRKISSPPGFDPGPSSPQSVEFDIRVFFENLSVQSSGVKHSKIDWPLKMGPVGCPAK